MRVFVDTSALIAYLDADDLRHAEAHETFRWLLGAAQLVTHNYVVVESVAVASRKLGSTAVRGLTDEILPLMTMIWIDKATHNAAMASHRGGPAKVSLVDYVSFAVMRAEGIDTCFAFDRDFVDQGFHTAVAPGPASPSQVHEALTPYSTDEEAFRDLVSVSEISARAQHPISTVQSWRRRHEDFPSPVAKLAAGPIWDWANVAEWISSRSARREAVPSDLHGDA